MAKINITTPTGNTASLSLLSAFKADGNTYIVFDSERTGSMGLPIIYISKYGTKLEKITDPNEWQTVKNYLKGIINGTSFEYINIADNLSSDEAFYTPLTLPTESFLVIKNRYQVKETVSTNVSPEPVNLGEVPVAVENLNPDANTTPVIENASIQNVMPVSPSLEPVAREEVKAPEVTPVIPNVAPISNIAQSNTTIEAPVTPTLNEPISSEETQINNNFNSDKETFLKACENMFDALISKYQKQLDDILAREKEIERKEKEINEKLASASEHLANAEAREKVANIAHDNAQKVMDINNFMPVNPNATTNS